MIVEIPTVLNDSTVALDNDIKARLASNYRDNYTFIFRPAHHLEEDLGPWPLVVWTPGTHSAMVYTFGTQDNRDVAEKAA